MAAATSTLQTIQQKVRRITRSPSTAQLSENDLNQYINTFIENDIPTTVKLFSLRTVLTFYTQPGVDVYKTNSIPGDPLNNFQNVYTAVHPPVYIAGVAAFFTQDRGVFYGNWPQTNFVSMTGLFGNASTGPFSGSLPSPFTQPNSAPPVPNILQNSVLLSALDTNGTAMQMIDLPYNNQQGYLIPPGGSAPVGNPVPSTTNNFVNYLTGAFTVTFPRATMQDGPTTPNPIWAEAIYFVAGIPTTMLYYNNEFTLRPVPDKSYVVEIEANMRPTELLVEQDVPQITQWWQWIALEASRKILEDRMDYDSVNMLMPTLLEQRGLALSTSMDQYTNQRTITIYTNNGIWNSWNNFGRWPY
jgi:hypothetical protein